jgi:methylated-DNA-[protein]-cysteine S-methyltransferase
MHPNLKDYQAIVPTPFGALGVCTEDQRLRSIDLLPGKQAVQRPVDAATTRIIQALQDYLDDPSIPWNIEPLLEGTEFQQRVWQRLRRIPVGETVTYGQLAQELQSSPRAVGNACRANPCALVVPCHRVVGKQGLGGFAGKTSGPKLQLKIWLLVHEGVLPTPSGTPEKN